MTQFVDPFDPWDTLTMWQRIDRLIHDPRTYLRGSNCYPIVHCWSCEYSQSATSWTVFREYGPESDAKPYRAKYIDWNRLGEFTDKSLLLRLEDPVLKIAEGMINAAKFKAMYEKAKTITVPLLIEGMAPNSAIRDAGCRVYPRFAMWFGHSQIPAMTEAWTWSFELERFVEDQLRVS